MATDMSCDPLHNVHGPQCFYHSGNFKNLNHRWACLMLGRVYTFDVSMSYLCWIFVIDECVDYILL